ncbi:tRNA N6-adenosine(37)-N6-threonylcarbamoyltransferase complex dimerization subunit TsaB [Arachidicoccus ginsenosidimutans]|uniref:tRNA (adenosine(37)-N6)-threonylcarbamoyltransferase complex dimerization subunit type 1 TsaB n=1 Tax=Arachidicoccus sp. BS20 TaxID=1850526 RepID=UPI0007F11F41|nr:tRNA (adenosine(37)-N6)-threonylcarbamoyltransferase complex dimerization subunit type 1 TsaB [Arachidicoccus sp. BS20]ANI90215.1 tRNA N6-adenosine(37)-N6-threonylcarbamoyltransferase complex dimerization subunit TsaB [Arachidicoccus sp. BS20]
MALILLIDTALENASIVLADTQHILAEEKNSEQKNHAAFVQTAIESISAKTQTSLKDIDAVAVSAGPGSYTGLRVGMASAKGLCFALNKPLILLNTLKIMAKSTALQLNKQDALYAPMIDARRMEVFAALYDFSLNEIEKTSAFILTEQNFSETFLNHEKEIIFFGNGMDKWKAIAPQGNFSFPENIAIDANAINALAQQSFEKKLFADLAYSEPVYAKSFYTTAKPGKTS